MNRCALIAVKDNKSGYRFSIVPPEDVLKVILVDVGGPMEN